MSDYGKGILLKKNTLTAIENLHSATGGDSEQVVGASAAQGASGSYTWSV